MGKTNLIDAKEDTNQATHANPVLVLVYLFFGFGLLALGMGLIPALVTSFRAQYGLSGVEIANVHNAKDIGSILAMLGAPFLLLRLGVSRTILAALVLALAGAGLFVGVHSYLGVLGGAALHGGAFALGATAIVTDLFRLPERYRTLAGVTSTFGVASLVAPVLVGVWGTPEFGYNPVYWLFVGALGLLLGGGLVLETMTNRTPVERPEKPAVTKAHVRRWAPPVLVYASIMAAETIVVSWVGALAQWSYGATLVVASVLLAVLWGVYTPVRALGDVLVRRFPAQLVVFWGLLVAAIGAFVVCLGSLTWAYVGVVVFTLGMASLVPIYQGWVLTGEDGEFHGLLNSAMGLTAAFVTTVTVWVTGVLIDVDTRLPFLAAAGMMVIIALWVLGSRRRALKLTASN